MARQEYDLLVIGAGAAGSAAATTAAKNGTRVALIERDKIGGACLNYGCDPTKTLLETARLLYRARHADRYSLRLPTAGFEWSAVLERVRQVIDRMRGGTPEDVRADMARKGIDLVMGEAKFVSPHEVLVSDRSISAPRVIIATGCETVVPPIEGLKEAGFITNVQAVSLPSLPRRLAIIGGGAIGVEFAQLFYRFGVEVTVLEHSPALLDKEDRELADMLCKLLSNEGIRMETNVQLQRVQGVQGEQHSKQLTIRCGEREEEDLLIDEILIATGRRPELDSLQLEAAGVQTNKRGIAVDATLRTNVPHIWAAGDVTGGYQFTHVANEQGKVAAQNAFAREPQPFDDRVIPWGTFTDPALAHVGKTEEQLRQEGVAYRVGRMQLKDVERALINSETDGLVKLLVDRDRKILGGHILAAEAGDLLAPVVVAMHANLSVDELSKTLQAYPTMVEAVRWAADSL